jgi:transcriptional regulator with XRE-family HTH domain
MQHEEQHKGNFPLGHYIRERREALAREDGAFSLRQVAGRCGITPAYLSRVERGEVAPPGEETLVRLAKDLGEDPDVLLAMAGKISADLRAVILARPQLFAELIREMKTMPDNWVLRIVREVRDGNW